MEFLKQETRPNVVGKMSKLIQEFEGKTLTEWEIGICAGKYNILFFLIFQFYT